MEPKSAISSLSSLRAKDKREAVQKLSNLEKYEKKVKASKSKFINLLVAQVKYQNPMNPADPNQMMSSMFAMNGLEQQLETNKLLNKSIEMQKAHNTNQALFTNVSTDVLGKIAVYSSDEPFTYCGNDGEAIFEYNLKGDAAQATIKVFDARNSKKKPEVFNISKKQLTGGKNHMFKTKHEYLKPGGIYAFSIEAVDKKGKKVAVESFSRMTVEGVKIKDNQVYYTISQTQEEVPLSKIRELKAVGLTHGDLNNQKLLKNMMLQNSEFHKAVLTNQNIMIDQEINKLNGKKAYKASVDNAMSYVEQKNKTPFDNFLNKLPTSSLKPKS